MSPEMILMGRKRITPRIVSPLNITRPKIFAHSNNLRRKSGSPFIAKGEFLSIDGYVTDIARIPISDVRIRIWQTNHLGYYNHLLDFDDERYDVDFLGSGSSRTNNLGYYRFITIMPGYYSDRAPHIHFLLDHDHFDSLETQMFFQDHPRNLSDSKYSILSRKERQLVTAKVFSVNNQNSLDGKYAEFDITLNGIDRYKRY